jgi:hypothetical protein
LRPGLLRFGGCDSLARASVRMQRAAGTDASRSRWAMRQDSIWQVSRDAAPDCRACSPFKPLRGCIVDIHSRSALRAGTRPRRAD